jgi:hypothetical protein
MRGIEAPVLQAASGSLVSYFDAFSSREPVSTSLENALALTPHRCARTPDAVNALAKMATRP